MAIYNLPNYQDKDGLGFPLNFRRGNPNPLDNSSIWDSFEKAQNYATSDPTAYVGQILAVIDSDTKNVSVYSIQDTDGTLKEVGSAANGDGNSIVFDNETKTLKLYGFNEATEGQQLRIQNGKIQWFTPDTSTVEGLSSTVAGHTSDINDLKTRMEDTETAITTLNGEGEGSVSKKVDAAINEFATNLSDDGVVNTFKELVDYVADHGTEAADMAAAIDALEVLVGDVAVAVQITNAIEEALKTEGVDKYALATDLASAVSRIGNLETSIENKVDKVDGKELSTNDFTDELKLKLEGLNSDADANVLEVIKINGVALENTDKSVNIPIATAEALGLVKSSVAENGISVAADGTMSVNSINANKLVQTEGEYLYLDGGTSAS